jgi:tRNA-dihydrouridine synthase
MFESCVIRGRRLTPARFCAPLAGYTHSAFRRLLTELGGCGALWTEMLAARQILKEDFVRSPWLRRAPGPELVVFQLMVRAGDPLDRILARLGEHGVEAVDLNLACDAMNIRACEAGSALFENLEAMRAVATEARRHWPGLLLAKIRLGSRHPNWEAPFQARLRLLEDEGFDAVTLHPRFFEDKFGRRARHETLAWASSLTRLPLIANGDLVNARQVESLAEQLKPACAIMIGRMAVVQPWLFAGWERPVAADHAAIWRKHIAYIREDFDPPVALRRAQMFAKYYSANFAFGHSFRVSIANAANLDEVIERAEAFFARSPAVLAHPMVAGL